MADKESPGARRLRKQQELEKLNPTAGGLAAEVDRRKGIANRLKNALTGSSDDDYGTELSAGAQYARDQEANRAFKEDVPAPSIGEVAFDRYPSVMKAGREAAAQERREARGLKKGGSVGSASRRADGIATKGKTKGKII
jgi:hypothetical protein